VIIVANKQVLMNEIEALPANYIDEILRYVLSLKQRESFAPATVEEYSDTATVQEVGESIVERHLHAFKELAK